MTKRKKRPNRRPKRRIDLLPKKQVQTPETQVSHIRRNLIISGALGLGGLAAWRAGLLDVFRDAEAKEAPMEYESQEKLAEVERESFEALERARQAEYEKRASKIELPSASFSNTHLDLTETGIPVERLDQFVATYEALILELESVFELHDSDEPRNRACDKFLAVLTQAYHEAIGSNKEGGTEGDREMYELLLEVNKLLIHKGHYLFINAKKVSEGTDIESFDVRISTFKARPAGSVKLSELGGEYEVPIFDLSDQVDFVNKAGENNPDRSVVLGSYNEKAGAIVIHKYAIETSQERDIELFKIRNARVGNVVEIQRTEKLLEDDIRMSQFHEALHAWLVFHGFNNGPDLKGVKNKGRIDMGTYTLEPADYMGNNNQKVHELAAVGYGILHSGEAVRLFMCDILVGAPVSYSFAVSILIQELYEIAPPEFQAQVIVQNSDGSQTINYDLLALVLSKAPLERLHKIGEHMAKLGIYLTQE